MAADNDEELIVFHPDCGGELGRANVSDRFYSCLNCDVRVSQRDYDRIANPKEFIRPGAWQPLDVDPKTKPAKETRPAHVEY